MEEDVLCRTRATYQDREWRWPVVVDELLKVVHFEGELLPLTEGLGVFQRYARLWFAQSAYTTKAVHALWRTGHYIEAFTLLRQLYEVLVQLRYFQANLSLLEPHIVGEKKDRIKFKTMFDALSPGLYETLYKFLSTASHGGVTLATRAKFDAKQMTARAIIGVEFHAMLAESLLSLATAVVLGFLNAFQVSFPNNTLASDPEFLFDIDATRAWLGELLANDRILPANRDFFQKLRALVAPEVTPQS